MQPSYRAGKHPSEDQGAFPDFERPSFRQAACTVNSCSSLLHNFGNRIDHPMPIGYARLMHPLFMYGNSGIASVTSVKLSGSPGRGSSVLIAEIDIMTQPKQSNPPPRIVTLGGRVRSVGPLVPAHGLWECVDYAQPHHIPLEAYVSNAQVRALDEARDGKGDFNLTLSLEAQIAGSNGLIPSSVAWSMKVTNSDWARLLSEMEFEDRATFEVPVAGGRAGPPLDKAAVHMKGALDRVQHRQWADALTKCREVLDELQAYQSVQTPGWIDWGDKSKREAWGIAERLVAAQAAVRHMTHAGPHSAIGNADEQAVRLTVSMTAAVLRYYASR